MQVKNSFRFKYRTYLNLNDLNLQRQVSDIHPQCYYILLKSIILNITYYLF